MKNSIFLGIYKKAFHEILFLRKMPKVVIRERAFSQKNARRALFLSFLAKKFSLGISLFTRSETLQNTYRIFPNNRRGAYKIFAFFRAALILKLQIFVLV